MDDLDLEGLTKASLAALDWTIPKVKELFRCFKNKDRIELILNKLIENNYEISTEVRELMKDNYGLYENTWGCVLKALENYPLRCKAVIEQAIKRKWIKLNPKSKCKVKIQKIDKIDDACWGFKTVKRKVPEGIKHFTLILDGKDVEVYADPACPKNEVWIGLDKLDSGESLFGVFTLTSG